MQAIATQAVVNYLTVEAIQWAKNSQHPLMGWISSHTSRLNRILAGVASALTAAGISWHYSAGTLTIEHLTVPAMLAALGALLENWIGIKILYKILYPGGGSSAGANMLNTPVGIKGGVIAPILLLALLAPGCAAQRPPALPHVVNGGPDVKIVGPFSPVYQSELVALGVISTTAGSFDKHLLAVEGKISDKPAAVKLHARARRIQSACKTLSDVLKPGPESAQKMHFEIREQSRTLERAAADLAGEKYLAAVTDSADRLTLETEGRQMHTLTVQVLASLKTKEVLK